MDCYSYTRFSSAKQSKGMSVERQQTLVDEWCQRHDLTLKDKTFEDLGVSGFKGDHVKHGALGVFIQSVRDGVIKTPCALLIEDIDRLSRQSVDEALYLFQDIVRLGVEIHVIRDNQIYSAETIKENWTKLIITLAGMARAHSESKAKSDRTKAAVAKRHRDKDAYSSSTLPAWLKKQDGTVIVDLEKGRIVRRVFELYLSGVGVRRIAKQFIEEGVPAFGKSGVWQAPYLYQVIKSPKVIGTLTNMDGTDIEGFYPAAVDKKIWLRAQDQRSVNVKARGESNKRESPNLFTGLNVCGCCGSSMRYDFSRNREGRTYSYLGCSRALLKDGTCDNYRHRYEPLEFFILHGLIALADFKADTRQLEEDLSVAKGQVATAQQEVDKWIAALDVVPTIGSLGEKLADAQRRMEAAKGQVQTVEQQIIAAKGKEDMSSLLLNIEILIDKARAGGKERREVRALVLKLVDSITVEKDGSCMMTAGPYWVQITTDYKKGSHMKKVKGTLKMDGPNRQGEAIRHYIKQA
ncbi:recombinase family protein [Terasakiella sp.]|uniref:recombinase family protein n=1 Tax=Terasakiella sp. TaxID=2034861 RepID=UPI003AA82758